MASWGQRGQGTNSVYSMDRKGDAGKLESHSQTEIMEGKSWGQELLSTVWIN